mgnify:CR=1 FL=1
MKKTAWRWIDWSGYQPFDEGYHMSSTRIPFKVEWDNDNSVWYIIARNILELRAVLRRDFGWEYRVEGNRFLRGMVRGLVGTMVKAGRGKMDVEGFREVLLGGDQTKADFSAPAQGLFLERVRYPDGVLG